MPRSSRRPARMVAFLRAINVGGHVVKMDRLREIFTAMDLANVQTFIQTGNVIFDSSKTSEDLEALIEARLEKVLGYPVATFIRTPPELREILVCPAITAAERKAAANIMVGFTRDPIPAERQRLLKALCGPIHQFRAHDREIYWLRSKLGDFGDIKGSQMDKAVGVATFRSLTTVTKIVEKYSET
jgi:uncharacterized protein (DUF1697 family)